MLRRAGHPGAQPDQHQHNAGCGHQGNGPAVQRSAVHDVLRTPGRALDEATRSDMEARLGADFSDVRIHNDSAARASAAEVGARAYTSGTHVVIGDGGADKHTLAHELTHVIQQRQGPVSGTDNGSGLSVSDPSDRFEREAEANARRAMSVSPPSAVSSSEQQAGGTGGRVAGQPAIQRIIYDTVENGGTEELFLESRGDALAHFANRGFTENMLNRLGEMAADEDEMYTQAEAMARVRNTVTGAINGITPGEINFLAALANDREQVSAYDPDMMPMAQTLIGRALRAAGLPENSVVANRASIAEFGHHVPHTDIFVPHPGPWIHLAAPNDLATCLEHVLGPSSHASVLTDNEPTQGFAQTLTARIDALNNANADTPDYIPLTYTVTDPELREGGTAELGNNLGDRSSVPYKTVHYPNYRVIRISRA
nr:DUF4157 domain-containing protein [Streptomyces sp. YSPA8]